VKGSEKTGFENDMGDKSGAAGGVGKNGKSKDIHVHEGGGKWKEAPKDSKKAKREKKGFKSKARYKRKR